VAVLTGVMIVKQKFLFFLFFVLLAIAVVISVHGNEGEDKLIQAYDFSEGVRHEIIDTVNCMAPEKRFDYALLLMKIYAPNDKYIFDQFAPRKMELIDRMKAESITMKELQEFHSDDFAYIAGKKGNFTPAICKGTDCFLSSVDVFDEGKNTLVLRTGYMTWGIGSEDLFKHYKSQDELYQQKELARLRDREFKRQVLIEKADRDIGDLKVKHLQSKTDIGKMRDDLLRQMICDDLYELRSLEVGD